jgi:hypothetical protein
MVRSFAKLFDHSIVRPDATSEMVYYAAKKAAELGTGWNKEATSTEMLDQRRVARTAVVVRGVDGCRLR